MTILSLWWKSPYLEKLALYWDRALDLWNYQWASVKETTPHCWYTGLTNPSMCQQMYGLGICEPYTKWNTIDSFPKEMIPPS